MKQTAVLALALATVLSTACKKYVEGIMREAAA